MIGESRKEKTKSNLLLHMPTLLLEIPALLSFCRRNGWAEGTVHSAGTKSWRCRFLQTSSSCRSNCLLWVDVWHCMSLKRRPRMWQIVSSENGSQDKRKQRCIRTRKSCQSLFEVYVVETGQPWIMTRVYFKTCSGCPGHRNAFSFKVSRHWNSTEWTSKPYKGRSDLGDTKY